MSERIQPIRLLVSVMASIMLLVTLITPLGSPGTANASTVSLTVAADGDSPGLTPPTTSGSDWSYEVTAGVGTLTVTGDARVKGEFIRDRLNEAPLTIVAPDITISDDILGTSAHRLTFKSGGNIVLSAEKSITTSGGDVIFWAHSGVAGSDTASSGHIALLNGSSVNTGPGAGDIIFGGGTSAPDGVPTGFVFGARATSLQPPGSPEGGTAAILFDRSNVTAGDGAIRAKAHGTGSGNALQTGFWVNQGVMSAGVIEIEGNGSTVSRPTSTLGQDVGIYVQGATMTASQSLSLTGKAGTIKRTAFDGLQIGVVIASWNNAFNDPDSPSSLTATGSGSISIQGTGGSSASHAGTPTFTWGVQVAPNQIISAQDGDISFTGEAGYKGNVALTIDAPLSTTGTVSLTGVASTASPEAGRTEVNVNRITAGALRLFGPGEFTITNQSNAIGTIAAGSPTDPVRKLSVFDSADGLTIGTVGGLSGLHSSGDILVETGTGDINLTGDITTSSTTATAIRLNAGKTSAPADDTGGDIIVSGLRTITTGPNGIARFFSGSEARSTGLTALVGGSGNLFYGVDEGPSSAGLTFEPNGRYALYRSSVVAPPTNNQSSGGTTTSTPRPQSSPRPQAPVTDTPVVAPPRVAPRPTRASIVSINTAPVSQPVERLGLQFDPNAPTRATVGGAVTQVNPTSTGSDALSLSAGAFRIGVNVAGVGEVQTDTPSRSPELFLPRGQSAAVSGGGSYPGSFVQLWLTGNGSDSRELARIPVGPDGTFASNFALSPGSLDMPVPIGRQVLQVVGYDEAGNQTVVDMTINIGQGVPAPEPNREAGALPALAFGQSLATSGGIPERVSLTGLPDTGTVAVEGDGWLISVTASRDNGVVENSDGNVLVRLNQSSVGLTEGRGFLPGTLATVWLFSDPTLVSTVTVDEDGQFAAEFLVDARLIAPGEHTLQVQGVGYDGFIKAANLGVLVEQPMAVTSESASSMLFWILGLVLLALVIVFWFVIARRRRNQEV